VCFSSTIVATPARASRNPSMIPAGPPPAMQQRVASVAVMRGLSSGPMGLVPSLEAIQGRRAIRRDSAAWRDAPAVTFEAQAPSHAEPGLHALGAFGVTFFGGRGWVLGSAR
jgi:hypothetical protein